MTPTSSEGGFEAFVCPVCGFWIPARGARSFFNCDGRLRFARDDEGYFIASPLPHESTECERVALVPEGR